MEQELIKLEKSWNDALVKHDWAFIDRILADDHITMDSDGVVANKAQEMVILRIDEKAKITVDLEEKTGGEKEWTFM